MNIVHYIMGIPPLRRGGLIRYAIDLAEEQAKQQHKVSIIYAGEIQGKNSRVSIKKRRKRAQVTYYEIINPLPVSVSTGMCDEKLFTANTDSTPYREFFVDNKVQILHIHSLMGLHLELVEEAKKVGTKIVFTSHDYFGICPKTDMIKDGTICSEKNWENCNMCCAAPISYHSIIRKQSHLFFYYLWLKQKISGKHNGGKKNKKNIDEKGYDNINYELIRKYYKEIFLEIDLMHYNSNLAKEMYERRLEPHKSVVYFVSHSDIKDKRTLRKESEIVHIGYLGDSSEKKGYEILFKALKEMETEYKNKFELEIYFEEKRKNSFIHQHKEYDIKELDGIFENMDLLIVPSQWAETFGLVALEAISHGVPIVVSENVGAKDLLYRYPDAGMIIGTSKDEIKSALIYLLENRKKIVNMSAYICEQNMNLDYAEYVKKIIEIYKTA